MDTNEIAQRLNTSPRQLRAFLRSPISTFVAVGSGARYEFDARDLPMLTKKFTEWQAAGKPKPVPTPGRIPKPRVSEESISDRDQATWDEEGPVVLPDIRDPRVLARVRQAERGRAERLEMRLMALGLHVSQLGDRR